MLGASAASPLHHRSRASYLCGRPVHGFPQPVDAPQHLAAQAGEVRVKGAAPAGARKGEPSRSKTVLDACLPHSPEPLQTSARRWPALPGTRCPRLARTARPRGPRPGTMAPTIRLRPPEERGGRTLPTRAPRREALDSSASPASCFRSSGRGRPGGSTQWYLPYQPHQPTTNRTTSKARASLLQPAGK